MWVEIYAATTSNSVPKAEEEVCGTQGSMQ